MDLQVVSSNKLAEYFDTLTDRFVDEFIIADEQVLLLALNQLIARILKLQNHWPEDILAYADYVDAKTDQISKKNKKEKIEQAYQYLAEFLDQDEQLASLKQMHG